MSVVSNRQDLVVLVPDKSIEWTIRGVLGRPRALGIRPVSYEIFVHPERDPGCLRKVAPLLRPCTAQYHHALVVFDREGCGDVAPRAEMEKRVENALSNSGWAGRCAAVVIDPELEAWAWSDSPEVDRVLGWQESLVNVRNWLRDEGFAFRGSKPDRPKEAMQAALRQKQRPWSSALFRKLSERVSLTKCTDPAFDKLRTVLQKWF